MCLNILNSNLNTMWHPYHVIVQFAKWTMIIIYTLRNVTTFFLHRIITLYLDKTFHEIDR